MYKWKVKKAMKKAEVLAAAYYPGKSLKELEEVYKEFLEKFNTIKNTPGKSVEDTLFLFDEYEHVLEIADLYPEMKNNTWRSLRGAIEALRTLDDGPIVDIEKRKK